MDSTGVPQFKRTWAVYRTQKGYQVVGKIQQDLDIFRMPVEIRVYTEGRKPVTAARGDGGHNRRLYRQYRYQAHESGGRSGQPPAEV